MSRSLQKAHFVKNVLALSVEPARVVAMPARPSTGRNARVARPAWRTGTSGQRTRRGRDHRPPRGGEGRPTRRARSPPRPHDVSARDAGERDRRPAPRRGRPRPIALVGAATEERSLGRAADPRRRVARDPALSCDAVRHSALVVHLRTRAAARPAVGELPRRNRSPARRAVGEPAHAATLLRLYLANRGYDLRLIQDYLGHDPAYRPLHPRRRLSLRRTWRP